MSSTGRQTSVVPPHDGQSGSKAKQPRIFKKCKECRRDRKRCETEASAAAGSKCTRCIEKGFECGERVRAPTTQTNRVQERATIDATHCLLWSCQQSTLRLKEFVYPWPCGSFGQKAFPCPKSQSLREDLEPFASSLNMQFIALHKILGYLNGLSVEDGLVQIAPHITGVNARTILACIAHIPSIWPDRETSGQTASYEQYVLLARLVKILCTRISDIEKFLASGSEAFLSMENGIPASHIAYMNGDKHMAIQLWWHAVQPHLSNQPQTVYADQNIDVIGRTLPQLVAEAGDFETLRIIAQYTGNVYTGSVMLHANPDKRGLSLLALAMCAPREFDLEFLSMLLDQRPFSRHLGSEPSLLDLALLSRSEGLVQLILRRRIACEPFDRYVKKAIELCEANLALLFVPSLKEAERGDQHTVDKLADLAEAERDKWTANLETHIGGDPVLMFRVGCWLKGFPELVEALRNTVVCPATPRQIVAEITQATRF